MSEPLGEATPQLFVLVEAGWTPTTPAERDAAQAAETEAVRTIGLATLLVFEELEIPRDEGFTVVNSVSATTGIPETTARLAFLDLVGLGALQLEDSVVKTIPDHPAVQAALAAENITFGENVIPRASLLAAIQAQRELRRQQKSLKIA
jgi:hypothetical protein